jgi:uncharacterized membrane protein YjjP (DUF1212 family)
MQTLIKPHLSYEELTDVIDLSLWAGQLLLQYGAETSRIEETVYHIGTGLGCDGIDIIVSPDGLLITLAAGHQAEKLTDISYVKNWQQLPKRI